MCDCVNGTCNATTGCVCADGYSGLRCDQGNTYIKGTGNDLYSILIGGASEATLSS